MNNEETPWADRFVPYAGFFAGGFLAAGILSWVYEGSDHREWMIFFGIVLFYFAEGWNRVMRRKQAYFRRLHLRDTARLCALDSAIGHDKVRSIYENSIEKTEDSDYT